MRNIAAALTLGLLLVGTSIAASADEKRPAGGAGCSAAPALEKQMADDEDIAQIGASERDGEKGDRNDGDVRASDRNHGDAKKSDRDDGDVKNNDRNDGDVTKSNRNDGDVERTETEKKTGAQRDEEKGGVRAGAKSTVEDEESEDDSASDRTSKASKKHGCSGKSHGQRSHDEDRED